MLVMVHCEHSTLQTGGCGRETDGTTCERPDNPFSSPSFVKTHPIGIRLDYILYRNNAGIVIFLLH